MNRSYSKKRHIQETNDRLEKRFLNEGGTKYTKNILTEKDGKLNSIDPYEHILGALEMDEHNPSNLANRGNDKDIIWVFYYPYNEHGQALRYLQFNTTDNTVKWYNGCELSKGGRMTPNQDGSLTGGWLTDKDGRRVSFVEGIGNPASNFGDTDKHLCDKYIMADDSTSYTINPDYKEEKKKEEKKKVTPSGGSSKSFTWDTTCDGESKPFKKGCKSETIRKVQGCLNITDDGLFGSGTQSAVKAKINQTSFTNADIDKLCGTGGQTPPKPTDSTQKPEEAPTETPNQYRF